MATSSTVVLRNPEAGKGLFIGKNPDVKFPWKAQLIVSTDEIAVFLNKTGECVATLPTGNHVLDMGMPFLGQLVDKFTPGNYFVGPLYYVSLAPHKVSLPSSSSQELCDPTTSMPMRPKSSGELVVKVTDAGKLVAALFAKKTPMDQGFTSWLQGEFNKIIDSIIPETITRRQLPILQVAAGTHTTVLKEDALVSLRAFAANLGMEIIKFDELSVTLTPKDLKRLQDLSKATPFAMPKKGDIPDLATLTATMPAMPPMGMPMANGKSREQIMATLRQLGDLKAAGVISEEELAEKTKALMAELA